MTWPGWADILPTVTLAATLAGMLWAVVRLVVYPVADRAASEAEKRAAAAIREAVDGLYDRLKGNDFRHVEDGLKALGNRIDEVREDFGGRLDRMGGRLDGMDRRLDGMDGRLDRMDGRFDRMDRRIDGVRKDVGERLDRAREERQSMEARLMAAIEG